MKHVILLLAILISPTAGAGSQTSKSFTLRCTQGADRYAVKFTAPAKHLTELMHASMLRRGTISRSDLCVTTTSH